MHDGLSQVVNLPGFHSGLLHAAARRLHEDVDDLVNGVVVVVVDDDDELAVGKQVAGLDLPPVTVTRAVFEKMSHREGPDGWLAVGEVGWYDYAFAVLHASLFAFPLLLPGVLLWRRGPDAMKRGAAAVTLISMAGYLTYVLFPLTPPWMAKLEGSFPEVQRIVFDAMGRFTSDWLQGAFQPSPRGAMPSLHAGLPFMTLLVALHEFGRRAAWVALPVAAICFEVVYGAEHYVIDIMAGLVYGFAAYAIVYRFLMPDGTMRRGGGRDAS